MTIIDRFKKIFNPIKQLSPKKQIKKIIKRAYEAAQPSDQFKKISQSTGPNQATQMGAEKIRDHARHLDENHDLSISVLDTLVSKIVGKGIIITPMVKKTSGELDEDINDQIRKHWKNFEKRPEVTRSHSMATADRLLTRTWLRDGEALLRFVVGRTSDLVHASEVPMSFEMIEPDYLPFIKNEEMNGKKIIQGIEINRWGAPVRYHILKESPFQIYPGLSATNTNETFPISAEEIKHIKFVRRMTQLRGVSIFHGVIRRLENIKDYEESEQIAARVAAAMTGYVKKNIDMGAQDTSGAADRDMQMEPGMIWDNLFPGEEIGTISSDRPNTGLFEFRNAMLRAVAAGTMTSFSSVSRYYEGSYSSMRQELVESKVNYDILREVYVSEIKKPVYEKYIETAHMFGMITPGPETDLETLYEVEISGIPTPWIDPKKEIEAYTIAKKEKFLSRAAIIRQMGGDAVAIMAEIEKELEEYPAAVVDDPDNLNQEEEEIEEDEEDEEEENENNNTEE